MRARGFPKSWVVSGRPTNLVADKSFVVSKMFCPWYQSQVDLVDIHCIGILRGFLGFREGQNVVGSALEFLHLNSCIVELTSLVEPHLVVLQFFKKDHHFKGQVGRDCFAQYIHKDVLIGYTRWSCFMFKF